MTKKEFVKIMTPFWIIESTMVSIIHIIGNVEITVIDIMVSIISVVILPFFIGIKIVLNGGNKLTSALGASSLAVIRILIVFIIYTITSTELLAYIGVLISVIMIVSIQIIIGIIGSIYTKKFAIKKPEMLD